MAGTKQTIRSPPCERSRPPSLQRLHGEGLATEAALAAVELAREAGLERIVALVQPSNLASRRVAAKVGFDAGGKIEHAGLPHLIYWLSLA